ncbi:MAG: GTP 3',8-cyclase [Nitrospira sp.]|nr:GTP 3',8-cyclase [Nitrospira sp.]
MLRDTFHRPLKDLRISVTDRCNFRCLYCMPFDEYAWIPKEEILSFDEIARLAGLFVQLGVDKIRLTGGEPLLRPHLEQLISRLSALSGLDDLCLTTNGSLLADKVPALALAGLRRVNVSIDTLDPEKFGQIRRRGDLTKVLEGLFAAKSYGLHPIKINAVIERGLNDDDIIPLVKFSRANGFAIRFIEYMDVGNANGWISEKVVSKKEILETINAYLPLREIGRAKGSAPSVDYQFMDGSGDVGVISSVTEPFCSSCTRARLTANGKLVTCLFAETGHDLREFLRNGATDEAIVGVLSAIWGRRTDRYSDERLEAINSPDGFQAKNHRKIEMISLGG